MKNPIDLFELDFARIKNALKLFRWDSIDFGIF